jgi:hypothetical protein
MDADALAGTAFVTMLLIIVLLGHFIRRIKFKYATEGSIALLLGLLVGGMFYAYFKIAEGYNRPVPFGRITLNSNVFFHVLLPPIIFYAGFSVKKKLFFRNFSTIAMFGIVGTFFYTALIALATYGLFVSLLDMAPTQALHYSLAVGAIFSCSDTVSTLQVLDQDANPILYSLVFGEGVVNDATAIVLLGAVQKLSESDAHLGEQLTSVLFNFIYLFIASLALGVGFGLLSSLIVRHAFRHHATGGPCLLPPLPHISTQRPRTTPPAGWGPANGATGCPTAARKLPGTHAPCAQQRPTSSGQHPCLRACQPAASRQLSSTAWPPVQQPPASPLRSRFPAAPATPGTAAFVAPFTVATHALSPPSSTTPLCHLTSHSSPPLRAMPITGSRAACPSCTTP